MTFFGGALLGCFLMSQLLRASPETAEATLHAARFSVLLRSGFCVSVRILGYASQFLCVSSRLSLSCVFRPVVVLMPQKFALLFTLGRSLRLAYAFCVPLASGVAQKVFLALKVHSASLEASRPSAATRPLRGEHLLTRCEPHFNPDRQAFVLPQPASLHLDL